MDYRGAVRAQVFVVGEKSAMAGVSTEFHPTRMELPNRPPSPSGDAASWCATSKQSRVLRIARCRWARPDSRGERQSGPERRRLQGDALQEGQSARRATGSRSLRLR